jgi:hypothetical protein
MEITPNLRQEIKAFSKMLHSNKLFVKITPCDAVLHHKELGSDCMISISPLTEKGSIVNMAGRGDNPIARLKNLMDKMTKEGTIELQPKKLWDAEEPYKVINYKI